MGRKDCWRGVSKEAKVLGRKDWRKGGRLACLYYPCSVLPAYPLGIATERAYILPSLVHKSLALNERKMTWPQTSFFSLKA
jgi:hypothetical protein